MVDSPVRGLRHSRGVNRRFNYLLGHGQPGLSVAFDLPTQMGLDSDDPRAEEDAGMLDVAIDSLADMEVLFDGIPLAEVSTSMTINAPAPVLAAMYIVVAEKQGAAPDQVNATTQNDVLKEYVAQDTFIYPPRGPHCAWPPTSSPTAPATTPRFNAISLSGYHMRGGRVHGRAGDRIQLRQRHRLHRRHAAAGGRHETTSPGA